MSLKIRVPGKRAPKEMTAGSYIAKCVGCEEKRRGRNSFLVLTFVVVEPASYANVMLLQWLAISETMNPASKFVRHWEIAANRQAGPADELGPEVFLEKIFEVDVGFRQSDGSGHRSITNAGAPKDESDFLRVHAIARRAVPNEVSQPYIVHSHRHSDSTIEVGGGVGGLQHQPQPQPQPKPEPQPKQHRVRSHMDTGGRDTTAEAGHSTQESLRLAAFPDGDECATAADLASSAEEYTLLRTKSPATLRAVGVVKTVFQGARLARNGE